MIETEGVIKVTWTSPWHGFGGMPQVEIEYRYDYASKELTISKKYSHPNEPVKHVDNVVLSPSQVNEVKQFLEDRSNIKRFFQAASWPGGHDSTTTLTIIDVDGKSHTIQQLGDFSFKHPFGFETSGTITATWTSARGSHGDSPVTVLEYAYSYELSLLTCHETVYERKNGTPAKKSSGKIKLPPSKEKEIIQFFVERGIIARFFQAESWQGGDESATILKIRDVDGKEYAIQQIDDDNYKHPFGE